MIDPKQYDWRQFSLTFYYNAHITRVFRTWTTAEGLESFFIERCLFSTERSEPKEIDQRPEVGDRYSWQFRQDFEVQGEIKTYLDREQFSFSFGDMHVDIYFRVVGEQTEVQLVQSNIPNTAEGQVFGHLNCRSCWTFFMTNLSSVLDHNHDLRDQNPELVSSMEVGYIPYSKR
jgi:uncharacterized protein YndB with AHSA1/START domain